MLRFDSFGKVCFASVVSFLQPNPSTDFFSSSRGGLFSFGPDAVGAFRVGEFDGAFRFFGSA